MPDEVSVSSPLTTNDVNFSFTLVDNPVSVSSPISIDDVLVSVNDADDSVSVSVTSEITDVSVTVENVTNPISVSITEALTEVNVEVSTGSAQWTESFDTVSRNLSGYPYIVYWNGNYISSVVFNLGSSTVTKTYNYTSGKLTSIVLSGNTPSGISLVKTLSYFDNKIQSVTYS